MLSVLILFGFGIISLQAQDAKLSSGGEAVGTGGSVSYSVGQVVYTTQSGTNGSVVQGVQQAFEISVVQGIKERKDISLGCIAYPNPTTDYLNLKIGNTSKSMSYELSDISGKQISKAELKNDKTIIKMNQLMPAIYFVKVFDDNQIIKTFKIVKK